MNEKSLFLKVRGGREKLNIALRLLRGPWTWLKSSKQFDLLSLTTSLCNTTITLFTEILMCKSYLRRGKDKFGLVPTFASF